MKKTITILVGIILVATPGFAQKIVSKKDQLKAHIIALDKAAWQAWKDKNVQYFKDHCTEDFLSISGGSVSTKAQVLAATPTECDAKSFALDNFQFVVLNETAVLLTYTVVQDAVCGGQKVPTKLRASVNYVKRNGKWLEAFYMDTPIE